MAIRILRRMGSRPWPEKFLVAFSFAGEQRDFVRALAESVEAALGPGTVFLDEWFEYYLAGHDADLKLQEIYGKRCELAVVCVSTQYGGKPWTQAEHEAIRARLLKARGASDPRERDAILPIRVGDGDVPGVHFNAIVPDARSKRLAATAQLILDRLRFLLPDVEIAVGTVLRGPPTSAHPGTTGPAPGAPPASTQGRRPLGSVKNEFCDRLGADWQKLADELQIPAADQRQIAARHSGTEGRGLWEWLEARKRLPELVPGCQAIGRADLAELLGSVFGAGSGPPRFPPVGPSEPATETDGPASRSFLESRIALWSKPGSELDRRFVQLTLLLDQGENAQGPRWQAAAKFSDLAELLAQTAEHPALVILGAPGTGKSTLLRHHEIESARAAVASNPAPEGVPLTFYLELNRYRARNADQPLPAPIDWLAEEWQRRAPELPTLAALLQQRRLTFLLDALNEVPGEAATVVGRWRDFLRDLVENHPGNRVVFSCRSLDYSASLSTRDLPVPQARLEELTDSQMEEFLVKHAPAHGQALWKELRATPQVEVFRTPYYLKLLVEQCHIPAGRAGLFTRFVRAALRDEIGRPRTRLADDRLFTLRDRTQLGQGQWSGPFQLPERGRLIPALAHLAFQIQLAQPGRQAAQVRITEQQALDFLGEPCPAEVLQAGADLGLLTPDVSRDEVCFYHQLLQEYFAARHLAAHPQPALVQQVWETATVRPPLEETLASLADSDPLPALPTSGWEETTVLAAGMARDPSGFVRELALVNLPLAGRAATQPEAALAEQPKQELRQALVTRSRSEAADLRARIAAGLALGELGDPRFERHAGPFGDYLLPPFVPIPAGRYPIGSDDKEVDDDEKPAHHVRIETFAIAKFPVTNAEWALFMAAGGYEDERWWETEQDKAWRRGDTAEEGPKRIWRTLRNNLKPDSAKIRRLLSEGRITSVDAQNWESLVRMTDREFEGALAKQYPLGRQAQPLFWADAVFNQAAQPVVGICWHEARAYCAWLSAQTGNSYQLPTEAQWEAAARGPEGRAYACGPRFDPRAANTFESHIRRTTPVGIFPRGDSSAGICDLSGNVWEWTSSRYREYPYNADDGREHSLGGEDARRVLRGGAWNGLRGLARASCRRHDPPDGRSYSLGVRLVRLSPIFK